MYLYNNWRSIVSTRWFHPLLLLIWLIIGISLRLANLTAKPPWTDEFSTLVFSLGNSFLPVPLDQAIAPDILLQPLQPQATANISDVWTHLSQETNHPPLYFFLAHLWMQLFPTPGGLVSLWGARSLSAIFGAASIPAIYGLGWLTFRSRLVSHLAAAMITVSPFGIFLAQEARHYTLAILWVIASVACLVIATRHIHNRTQLPISLVFSWVIINALGIATHYFFALTLLTEALVIMFLAWHQRPTRAKLSLVFSPLWQRIYIVAAGTFVAGLVWLPVFLQNSYGSKLTEWIQQPREGIAWISPIFQAFAAWLTMLYLLPVEAPQLAIVIASGIVMLIFFIWALPILIRGFKVQLQEPENGFMTQVLAGLVVGAIALFFIFTYFLGIDLTRGARYNFVYFPAVMVLLGASLAVCWRGSNIGRWGITGKKAVILIWLMGFFSAVTVVCNLGYQKYYRPDLFVQLIQKTSQIPVLIATTHITHVHIGEMMGVAREFKMQNSPSPSPLFLLAHQGENPNSATKSLNNTLQELPRPFDLWLVNFKAPIAEEVEKCDLEEKSLPAINGYVYELYHCK
ncbi:glycosyltransferase [Nodularia spumigena CS-591/12]|uniref:glycosyltransferase family 39 protein n=1 Tax=Nodularia spumigena TaxID=70799 RepID=UPI00232C93AD|nr:glycosyltransferase [Nodularia spumigena]MDB9304168.1 glycosyltransferase [Nodularia spumigena CS-591/12]MDB9343194.1 glycosyltransferase [Nodularia spumigena CS-588/06]MDB9371710.1 glycosyltransferase [Nodularia spumigena CS-586/05]